VSHPGVVVRRDGMSPAVIAIAFAIAGVFANLRAAQLLARHRDDAGTHLL
jgi:hypothetical protein